jgi:DNA-binding Xre family transcriptional regulator
MTLLLREAIGERLRRTRTAQRRTLREVSRAARVSLGYLSEVERGRKEASSELLAAICDALELPLSELLNRVAGDMGNGKPMPTARPVPDGKQPGAVPVPASASAAVDGGRRSPAVIGEELADLGLQPTLSHRLAAPIGEARSGVVVAA